MAHAEALDAVLQSLIEVTRALSSTIASDDFSTLAVMLDRRGELLEQQSVLAELWKRCPMTEGDRVHHTGRLHEQVELLEQLDKKIVTLFAERKKELAEKMKQAQNQKRLLAYSR